MILQTGGLVLGTISTRSKPASKAILFASAILRIPICFPSVPITRTRELVI